MEIRNGNIERAKQLLLKATKVPKIEINITRKNLYNSTKVSDKLYKNTKLWVN
jgi:hypothetical protein